MRDLRTRIAILAGVCSILGCATANAPPGWLPSPTEVRNTAYGAWIELSLVSGEKIRGEFIAVSDDTLYVLPASRLVAVPAEQVSIMKLSVYDSDVEGLAAWTVLGFLSTASHGFYLSITAPIWLIVGTVSSVNESRAPHKTYDSNVALGDLKIFTRFPQGLPTALDRTAFKPKSRS